MLINKANCVSAASYFTISLHEMSFVKDKVKRFESLNAADHDEPAAQQTQGKKFLFPGNKQPNKRQTEAANNLLGIPHTRSKPSILSEFEANLEEVWSVRKNIHHNSTASRPPNVIEALTQPSTVAPSLSVPKFNQNYSRHGAAMGAGTHQQSNDLPPLHKPTNDHLHNNVKSRRLPLHDSNNSVELPSLVKTSSRSTGFTLADSKRNKDDPRITNNVEDVFMSTTSKRKRTFKSGNDAFKLPGDSSHLHPHFAHEKGALPSERTSSYAQRMAEAHLKSAGLGQYTPKQSDYTKVEVNADEGKSTKWRKIDDEDEFSF